MKKIVIIDTTWPINSRTEKFKNTFIKNEYRAILSAWNRGENVADSKENEFVLNTKIGYGNHFYKLLFLLSFFYHTYKVIKNTNPNVVFASHWDSLVIAASIKLLLRREFEIIYDCLDLPTSKNKYILKLLQFIEKLALKKVKVTILASRFYSELYDGKTELFVFENYPSNSLNFDITLEAKEKYQETIDALRLKGNKIVSWIGVVRYSEIIYNLILSIKNIDFHLCIFGDGPSLSEVKNFVLENKLEHKVTFFGRYTQSELSCIYANTDVVWAAYPTLDYNAVYAISNKYFECSFFSKLPVFSLKTKMSENVTSDVLLVNEYDIDSISKELNRSMTLSTFKPYETTVFWEDRESHFIEVLNKI
ncbi:glycosyltransferase [Aliivibrio fischeri]|uniref:glycosyltransferase n=1 Tax=Aliivibrio fischeri TaxID=668 RepID=UPI0007C4D3D1|nr:glycosyltransferase [Aliivibrio fischeri]